MLRTSQTTDFTFLRCLALVTLTVLFSSCAGTPAEDGGEIRTAGPGRVILDFYRGPLNHLSAVRHGNCPMHPSCSEYARQAMAKHGEAVGWVMAMDRLLRCGRDEIRRVSKIRVNGDLKYYDPLEANDFWWLGKDDSDVNNPDAIYGKTTSP